MPVLTGFCSAEIFVCFFNPIEFTLAGRWGAAFTPTMCTLVCASRMGSFSTRMISRNSAPSAAGTQGLRTLSCVVRLWRRGYELKFEFRGNAVGRIHQAPGHERSEAFST
jgi:hypothetical protein